MRFIHPEFLWFLLFSIIPIILFFLNLQKVVKVDFTNVNFINELKKETSNRFKLKRILVMLARMLFIFFLVFAFAQPTFKKENEIKARHHLVYFDNSLSMTRKSGDGQLLDKAKLLLENKLSTTSRDKFSLITNSEQKINKDYSTKIDLLRDLSKVKSANAQLSVEELMALARRKKTDLEKELVFVSDFQASQFSEASLAPLADTSNKELSFKLISLMGETNNVFVDSVWVENKYLRLGSKVSVEGRLVNETVADKEVLVKCFSGNSQVSSVVVKSVAGKSTDFSLQTPLSKMGELPFKLSVEDPLVSFDNDYHFVLNVGKQINVLVLKNAANSYVTRALNNESLFKAKTFNSGSFNSSEIQKVDLLVLEGVADLNKLPLNDINQFVKGGGGMLFIPSARSSNSQINLFFKQLGMMPLSRVSKGKLEVDSKAIETESFFEGVFENTTKKVLNPWYEPFFSDLRGKAIIKSRIGSAFLSKINRGRGSVFLLNTSLEEGKTNFHKHSLFVPTQYLIAMASSTNSENLAYFTSQTPWLLKGVNPSALDNYLMVNARWQYVPEQSIKRNDLELTPEPEMLSGVYDVRSTKTKLTSIAVNYGREESYLQPQDLSFLEGNENVQVLQSDENLTEGSNDESGFSWWKWLILVALFWLLVETALIRFFK